MTARVEGVALRWLSTTEREAADTLLAAAFHGDAYDAARDRALLALGIKREGDDGHLRAWVRAMARENGLPEVFPQTDIGRAIEWDAEVSRWVFWLA